ncbi:MFS transporter [Rhodobaculum claviforme]|uniref:MFS transporter n=1 Tax=Rhodobaculum claviforme TaxID=1549854 RepID=A0A934TKJ3_9RHOB|nr:MFS transporter [Rhodobaculum claviforme]MBK5927845.1 MFS transporter [Rhodobaculum claviforme]
MATGDGATARIAPPAGAPAVTWAVIAGLSLCHLLNDVMQSMLAAIYPLLQAEFALSFSQIGLMTLAFQVTASLLQPAVGLATDRHPAPIALPIGMGATLIGLGFLAYAPSYGLLLAGAMLIGVGSAVFHPEASRVARLASGGRHGTAQSLFQVGGNLGSALGPLMAAFVVVPLGRPSIAWFAVAALLGMAILGRVAAWHGRLNRASGPGRAAPALRLPRGRVVALISVLAVLVLSKNAYTASISSYYTFFLMERFGIGLQPAQVMLFVFLGAMALGVALGGVIGDRVGALTVIWISILGALPFTLALPHVGLWGTLGLSVVIGVVLSCAFPAIVVYAQELVPGRVGMIAGLFFGFAFGMGGIAAAALGVVADRHGLATVYLICRLLPALGLLAVLLPSQHRPAG